MRRTLQFAIAVLRALRFRYRYGARMAMPSLRVLRSPRVSDRVWRARIRACTNCVLYDRTHKTCGDGQSLMYVTSLNRIVPAGCQCWMPLKARLRGARCYYAEIGEKVDWPNED